MAHAVTVATQFLTNPYFELGGPGEPVERSGCENVHDFPPEALPNMTTLDDCVQCGRCTSPLSDLSHHDDDEAMEMQLESSVDAHVPGLSLRSDSNFTGLNEPQLPERHTLSNFESHSSTLGPQAISTEDHSSRISRAAARTKCEDEKEIPPGGRKRDIEGVLRAASEMGPINRASTASANPRDQRLTQRNAHKASNELKAAETRMKTKHHSVDQKQRQATSVCLAPRIPSTNEVLHEGPPHKKVNLSPEAGPNQGQAWVDVTAHFPSAESPPCSGPGQTESATTGNYSCSKPTDSFPVSPAIDTRCPQPSCSQIPSLLHTPGDPPGPIFFSAAATSPPVTTSDAVPHLPEEALVSDETCNPQPARHYSTAPGNLDQVRPTTHNQAPLLLPVGRNEYVSEPPWGQTPHANPSPSSARAPNKHDTHFWHVPQGDLQKTIVPSFPEVPAVLFPWPVSPSPLPGQITKPPLPMVPPVWAQSRQELCESLSYFRSYQGGVYSQKKRARGYLLDGHPSAHDLWHAGGRVIISHAGGNSAVDKTTGQTILINDQTESSPSCAALISSYKAKQAIALIAGSKYYLFPYDLHHCSYVVLGYYLITHAWEEPERSSMSPRGYFIRWKFLFRWIEEQGQPWWIPPREPETTLLAPQIGFTPLSKTPDKVNCPNCPTCGRSNPTIYAFGWVCTHSTCQSFFGWVPNKTRSAHGYHAAFLAPTREASQFQGILSKLNIRPRLPVDDACQQVQDTMSRHFWKGWWCGNCGRLSCRERWTYWECPNCQNKLEIPPRPYSAKSLAFNRATQPFDIGKNMGITTETKVITGDNGFSHKCYSFHLPFRRGVIHHIQGNRRANAGADKIFLQYQNDAKDPTFFRRYSMKTHKLKGRMLSHYFSQNSGESYKYVGGTDNTVPLDKYSSVKQAVSLIRERVSYILGQDPMFNEILSAAYMAEQKMEFHSDGEKDLGPIVASLSLGSPAVMRFRPVPSKYVTPESLVTPGRKTPPMALTLTLRHGDVLVMEGAEIQEFYQHAVHPCGFRIAATARYIKTASLATHEQGDVVGTPGGPHCLGGKREASSIR